MKKAHTSKRDVIITMFLFSRAIKKRMRQANSNMLHRAVLLLLIKESGSVSVRQLSELFFVNIAALSETLTKMETEGYIKKVKGEDKRERYVRLTARGEREINTLTKHIDAKSQRAFATLTDKEVETLATLLSKLFDSARKTSK